MLVCYSFLSAGPTLTAGGTVSLYFKCCAIVRKLSVGVPIQASSVRGTAAWLMAIQFVPRLGHVKILIAVSNILDAS